MALNNLQGLICHKANNQPTDYAGDLVVFTNTLAQAESLLHKLDRTARGISLYINSNKTGRCG